MKIRGRLGLSKRRQAQLVRVMQVTLVGILLVGISERDLGIVVNATLGLVVTGLPALIERRARVTLDVGLTLWVTAAVFFHALGTVPLPFLGSSAYQSIWWWDHLTHLLSASVIAAAGYTVARVVDDYSDDVELTPAFTFAYLLLFVMASGVVWELIEFLTSVGASLLGVAGVLTQYGLEDTVLDLMFDTLGAVVVALVGTTVLSGLIEQVGALLDGRAAKR